MHPRRLCRGPAWTPAKGEQSPLASILPGSHSPAAGQQDLADALWDRQFLIARQRFGPGDFQSRVWDFVLITRVPKLSSANDRGKPEQDRSRRKRRQWPHL